MLVLSRKENESIRIGENVVVKVVAIGNGGSAWRSMHRVKSASFVVNSSVRTAIRRRPR